MGCIERVMGPDPIVVKGLEGTSQNFKAGDLVAFSSGQVILANASGTLAGVARRNASGTANTTIEVELADPTAVYSAQVDNNTTHAVALIGTKADFNMNTAAGFTLKDGNNDADIVALDPRDAVGATNGRVYFRFKAYNVEG